MYINKMIFMEYSELSKLPTAIYDAVVNRTDYSHSEITSSDIRDILNDLTTNPEMFSFTKEEFEDELHNILGEAYYMLLDGRLDFISVIYD